MEIFQSPETAQVLPNSTPITQSSINPQYNKNQLPLTLSSTNTPHTLNYATSLAVGLSGNSQTPRVTKGNL